MSKPSAVPILPIAAYQFRFRRIPTHRLPAYPGSTWRGALGWALRKTVCVTRNPECSRCLLYRQCVYPYVFETPPPADSAKMRRYTTAPHPFVLRIDPRQQGSHYSLGLTLFGRADRYLPYFIHALAEAGKAGLGRDRAPYELTEVNQAQQQRPEAWTLIYTPDEPLEAVPAGVLAVPSLPDRVTIELETPLRLKRDQHLVTPANFDFADLFGSLLRRISMLTYFHTDTPLETDFAALSRAARALPLHDPELRWYDWTRYSSRQDAAMEMGGILGRFSLEGADLDPFWPYLWLGQWSHAGKGATMGLGRYRIGAASLPGIRADSDLL